MDNGERTNVKLMVSVHFIGDKKPKTYSNIDSISYEEGNLISIKFNDDFKSLLVIPLANIKCIWILSKEDSNEPTNTI